ncbi:MAG: TrkH family potassium uptake protein [Rhodobacteraceae bacterium]|nr:TrkH family potassium uptake protein [Paracoccaceae bacterium]
MDFRAVALPIGRLLILIAGFLIIPAAADVFAGNPDWRVFLLSSLIVAIIGLLTNAAFSRHDLTMKRREAFVFVNVAWLVFCLASAIPLYASGLNISAADAFFESASGLTTTGATILTGLDHMPPGILLWRSLLQWIGGIGIVVIGIWFLPDLKVGGSQLFSMESSEKSVKPYGRIEPFIGRLLSLYGLLTVMCLLLYMLCGMTFFQAINHALTTVSTGGFSTSDSSFGQFDGTLVYWVAIIFMLTSSIPFLFLLRLAENKKSDDTQQIVMLLAIVAAASMIIFVSQRWEQHDTPFHLFTLSIFHVVSVITTTGYATSDYLQWGHFVVAIFFVLTFFGACSGSTSGGFKMFRISILLSYCLSILRKLVSPRRVEPARYNGHRVNNSVIEGVLVFAVLYSGTFALFGLAYTMMGLDILTAFSASITALANVGPGVGDIIGPSGTFQSLPDLAKWLLAAEMILGRLEIIAGLIILTPDFWRET